MSFSRRVSALDLVFTDTSVCPTGRHQIVSQCIVGGEGTLETPDLENALEEAAEAFPASRFVLRGHWGFKRWRAVGPPPRLRTVRSNWDGESLNDADFLDADLDVINGPIMEVVHVISQRTYLAFRVHHAVMDGSGALDFMDCFFKALRGEPLVQLRSSLIVEDVIVSPPPSKEKRAEKLKPLDKRDVVNPLGNAFVPDPYDPRPFYYRFTLNRQIPFILPWIIKEIADIIREDQNGVIRFGLPVSLRRFVPEAKAPANLTGPMSIDVEEDDNLRSLIKKINTNTSESRFVGRGIRFLMAASLWIPFSLHGNVIKLVQTLSSTPRKYQFSGVINALNIIVLEKFSTETFVADKVLCGPSRLMRGTPLLTLICPHENGTEIILAAANAELNAQKVMDFADKLQARLEIDDSTSE